MQPMDTSVRHLHLVGMRVDRLYANTCHSGKIIRLSEQGTVPPAHVELLLTVFTAPPLVPTISTTAGTLRVYVLEAIELGIKDASGSMSALAVIGGVKRRHPGMCSLGRMS